MHLRRTQLDIRFEMMPLIDVVFLLLTFFIYAMVLMVRAHLLPVELPTLHGGLSGQGPRVEAISITMDESGSLFLDAQPAPLSHVIAATQAFKAEFPDGRVYVAPSATGQGDRLPAFLQLVNRLRSSGIDQFFIVGRPEPADQPAPSPSQ
ncbi:MAG: biopolymer transporter ExbD [Planctomycetes bacterium]|nr:biopolymer transporter ExbD [Planctomycetota bacterium]NOG52886.1 biopolymer transporter ExbD [Planctomycetota bacterium]